MACPPHAMLGSKHWRRHWAGVRWSLCLGVLAHTLPRACPLVITFTGNVTKDFPSGPGVFIATDLVGDAPFPHADGTTSPSGWDLADVRYSYDINTDTAYFGGLDDPKWRLGPSRRLHPL